MLLNGWNISTAVWTQWFTPAQTELTEAPLKNFSVDAGKKIRREDSDALAGVSTWKTVAETHAITHREASSDQSGLITPNGKAIEDAINENVPLKDKHCEI